MVDTKLLSTRRAVTLVCAAILAGAALQALTTWVGLRAIDATLSTVASGACREGHAPPSAGTAPPSPASAFKHLPDVVEGRRSERDAQLDLRDQLINAFLAQKPTYAQACFASRPGPPRRYAIELTIDALGEETERRFRTGEGEEPQPELDACVRNLKVPRLRVRPPGKLATTQLDTRLP